MPEHTDQPLLLSDEQIRSVPMHDIDTGELVALEEMSPYRVRDFYEQARKQDKERIRELEAQLAGRSLPEQGEGPYTIDETIEWLKRRDIFVSAGSRSGFADNLPRVLLDFAAEQAGRLSAQIAHPPQVGATHPSQELIRAGDAMRDAMKNKADLSVAFDQPHDTWYHRLVAAWDAARQSSPSQPSTPSN